MSWCETEMQKYAIGETECMKFEVFIVGGHGSRERIEIERKETKGN